jgi:hypothetical protein
MLYRCFRFILKNNLDQTASQRDLQRNHKPTQWIDYDIKQLWVALVMDQVEGFMPFDTMKGPNLP